MRTCSIDGCDRIYMARGLCDTHYKQWETRRDLTQPDDYQSPFYGERPPADHPLWQNLPPVDDSNPIHTTGTAMVDHWPANTDISPPALIAYTDSENQVFHDLNRRVQRERRLEKNEQMIAEYFGQNGVTNEPIN